MSQASVQLDFDRRVMNRLNHVARGLRRVVWVRGLARIAAAALLLASLQFAADFLLSLERPPRLVLLVAVVLALATVIRRVLIAPLRAPLTPSRLAATLERRLPQLDDRLVSALQFVTGGGRPGGAPAADESLPMQESVVRAAVEEFDRIPLTRLLGPPAASGPFGLLASVVVVVAAVVVTRPDHAAAFVARNWLMSDRPWPSNREFVLESPAGEPAIWPRGDDLALVVRVIGDVPRSMELECTAAEGAAALETRPMNRVGADRFRCDFGRLGESVRVRFAASRWGAAERSRWHDVRAVERPGIRSAEVLVEPPAYTRQTPYKFAAGQTAGDAPSGSRITLLAMINKPVRQARLLQGDADAGSVEMLSPTTLRAVIRPQQSAAFRFALVDELGLEDRSPMTFAIRLLADRPPSARLTLPGVGGMITPGAALPVQYEFEDNWGLADARWEHRLDRVSAASQPAATAHAIDGFTPGQTRLSGRAEWDLAPLGLQPADRLLMSASAADFKDADGPNVGRSTVLSLRVVTGEELQAELSRRELSARAEFEQIIRGQELLRSQVQALGGSEPGLGVSPAVGSARASRTQRHLAGRVRSVRNQFESILGEMEINRLAVASVRNRLAAHIIAPLLELDGAEMPAAADLLDGLRTRCDAESLAAADAAIAAILDRMQLVLAHMIKWEGINEATQLLRDILKQQGDLNRQTEEEIERQLEQLFGPQDREP